MKKLIKELKPTHWLSIGVIAALAFYLLTQHMFFAIAVFALMAGVIIFEFTGAKNEEGGLLGSIAFALGLWLLISFLLNTTTPINIVTSCSMLPNLERGDVIILQGGPLNAREATVNADLSKATYELYNIQAQGYSARLVSVKSGDASIFNTTLTICDEDTPRGKEQTLCVQNVEINGKQFGPETASDTIVYDSRTPAGLIIHRAFLRLKASDGTYYLTKGDNNPVIDQQTGFRLVKDNRLDWILVNVPFVGALGLKDGGVSYLSDADMPLKGKVLLRIPYIGYLKLFLFLQFDTPAGCDTLLHNP